MSRVSRAIVRAVLPRGERGLQPRAGLLVEAVRVLVRVGRVVHAIWGVVWRACAAAVRGGKGRDDGGLGPGPSGPCEGGFRHGHVHRASGEGVPRGRHCAVHGHVGDDRVDARLHLRLRKERLPGRSHILLVCADKTRGGAEGGDPMRGVLRRVIETDVRGTYPGGGIAAIPLIPDNPDNAEPAIPGKAPYACGGG